MIAYPIKVNTGEVEKLPDGRPVEGGDLMTKKTFENFELSFEWKINKSGNSGLKYNVSEDMSQKYGSKYSALGFEYQLLDDGDEAYKGKLKPSQFSGSLYDLLPAKNIVLKPVGEFNCSRILVDGNHAEHWLNGMKVLEFEFGSKELDEAYTVSKFNKIPGFQDMSQKYGSKYSALGFEYQLLDDGDEAYKGKLKPSQFSGSLYDLLPAKNIVLKPVGEFNCSRILVDGNHAEHWLNGMKVLEFEFGSKELDEAYTVSKFNKIPGFQDMSQKYGSKYSALGFEYQLLDDGDEAYKGKLKPSQFSGSLYDLLPAKNIVLKLSLIHI